MSFVSIRSATLLGVQGAPVDIEIHLGMGLPGFTIVGQPDEACRESRNRVLAALSEVVVVVESRATGGSMITVEEAQKRDITVMAVPGSPRNTSSAGTNLLLQQGCAPVVSVDDVLVALGLDTRRVHPPLFDERSALLPDDATLAIAMAGDALTLDQLVLRTRRDVVDIAFALGRMESMGWVVNNGGWWEVLGAQTPAGYGGNHGGSHRLGN